MYMYTHAYIYIYIYLCTQLRNDRWKNDDCAPAAASESVGIKVLIYFGLFGASQRQEPFVGPVWPIIGTTQGVTTEVAACAYDTFSFHGFQISSNLFRDHVVLFDVFNISWAKAYGYL